MANKPNVESLTDIEILKILNERAKQKATRTVRTQSDAELYAQVKIQESGADVLSELTEKNARRIQQTISKELQIAQKLIETAAQQKNSDIKTTIEDYTISILKVFYKATEVSSNINLQILQKNPIVTQYIPELDNIIVAINAEPIQILSQDQKQSLIDIAEKVKSELKKLTTSRNKIVAGVKKLLSSDVTAAAISGASTRSPLVALGVYLLKQNKSKSSFTDNLNAKRKKLELAQKQSERIETLEKETSSIITPSIDNHANTTVDTDTKNDTNDVSNKSRGERRKEWKDSWSSSNPNTNQGQIVRVLVAHTKLLDKIYNISIDTFKVHQKMLEIKLDEITRTQSSQEESTLENNSAILTDANGGFLDKFLESTGLRSIIKIISGIFKIGSVALRSFITEIIELAPLIVGIASAFALLSGNMEDLSNWVARKLGLAVLDLPKEQLWARKDTVKEMAQQLSKGTKHAQADDWDENTAKEYIVNYSSPEATPIGDPTPQQNAAHELSRGTMSAKNNATDWSQQEAIEYIRNSSPAPKGHWAPGGMGTPYWVSEPSVATAARNKPSHSTTGILQSLASRKKIKGAQATGGGQIHAGTAAMASYISSLAGVQQFTAFNDNFHQENRPNSLHTKGLAIDFTIDDGKNKGHAMKTRLEQYARDAGVGVTVLDEYSNPSKGSTGGHMHLQFNTESDAEKFAAKNNVISDLNYNKQFVPQKLGATNTGDAVNTGRPSASSLTPAPIKSQTSSTISLNRGGDTVVVTGDGKNRQPLTSPLHQDPFIRALTA